jgi:hypothetical protein
LNPSERVGPECRQARISWISVASGAGAAG